MGKDLQAAGRIFSWKGKTQNKWDRLELGCISNFDFEFLLVLNGVFALSSVGLGCQWLVVKMVDFHYLLKFDFVLFYKARGNENKKTTFLTSAQF